MRTSLFLAAVMVFAASMASALEISTKNNVGGYFEYAGFTIVPVNDPVPASPGDLSAARAFEIFRPGQQAFTVGRLYTSCTCFQIEIDKKSFMPGERAVITLRNVRPTTGRNYPFYVQLGSPFRVVLRHDAFIISDQYAVAAAVPEVAAEAAAPVEAAAVVEAVEPVAVVAAESVPVATEAEAVQVDAGAAAAAVVVETEPDGEEYVLSDQDLLGK